MLGTKEKAMLFAGVRYLEGCIIGKCRFGAIKRFAIHMFPYLNLNSLCAKRHIRPKHHSSTAVQLSNSQVSLYLILLYFRLPGKENADRPLGLKPPASAPKMSSSVQPLDTILNSSLYAVEGEKTRMSRGQLVFISIKFNSL
jgi:hypothetical protein